VIDRPEPATIHMAERDASDLLFPLRGQHHRRLAGQPLMEETRIAPPGLQGREDPQQEPAGKVQLPRRPDRPDRDVAHGQQFTNTGTPAPSATCATATRMPPAVQRSRQHRPQSMPHHATQLTLAH
jgi:hypothetical protein